MRGWWPISNHPQFMYKVKSEPLYGYFRANRPVLSGPLQPDHLPKPLLKEKGGQNNKDMVLTEPQAYPHHLDHLRGIYLTPLKFSYYLVQCFPQTTSQEAAYFQNPVVCLKKKKDLYHGHNYSINQSMAMNYSGASWDRGHYSSSLESFKSVSFQISFNNLKKMS